ncbi:DUF350 domain-containing protein [Paenibacillus pinistramenti]|uniref:DUF350 domain-containing protein n=1 Tax=Paenibacillus pinistramenti TaxID=1768003 RepID=UPI001EF0A81E|nr:DUF350 domain-containing protein [Paenibacillus pinistramenti]
MPSLNRHEGVVALDTIDQLLAFPFGHTVGILSLAVLELVVFLACFEALTSYNCWEEIASGNMAAALATGGKIAGICVILRSAAAYPGINEFILWSSLGTLLLFIVYLLFEFFTPVFKIDEEIRARNTAAGVISMTISIPLALVIAACLV